MTTINRVFDGNRVPWCALLADYLWRDWKELNFNPPTNQLTTCMFWEKRLVGRVYTRFRTYRYVYDYAVKTGIEIKSI